MDWTEKHRPVTLADIVGNGPSVKKLLDWARAWETGVPAKRAVVLAGPPGTGKTSAALALARDMGWSVIELNASDARNAAAIKRVATAGAMHQTFGDDGVFHRAGEQAGRKLIVLDEADNLYERLAGENAAGGGSELGDRGGKTQIVQTIRETKQPIVLIVNDLYALQKGSGSAIRSLAETLKWTKVNVRSIPKALATICGKEGIQVDREVLEAIAGKAEGDLRAAVRDLESICMGRSRVTVRELESIGQRDTTANMFDVVRHVLKGRRMGDVRREVFDADATPEDMVLWIDENLPKEYVHPEDLVAGYDMLSRADVFLGRTRSTQNYRLWSYASELSTVGVMAVKQHDGPKSFVPFGFPQWLMKMSRSRGMRGTKDKLAESLGRATHQSKRKARMEQVEPFTALFVADEAFQARTTHELGLTDEEVAVLLGPRSSPVQVKRVRAEAQRLAEASPRVARQFGWGGAAEAAAEDSLDPDGATGPSDAHDAESGGDGPGRDAKTPAGRMERASEEGTMPDATDPSPGSAPAEDGRPRRPRAPEAGQQRLF